MNRYHFFQIILLLALSLFMLTSFAWDHSVELGYGYSHDPNNVKYNNSGFLLSADVFPLKRTPWTFWSINAALGKWNSSAPQNKDLTTIAIAAALRLYLFNINHLYPAYLLGSVGPNYLSSRKFGTNTQGSNLDFQLFGGLGAEFNKVDVNLRLVHYSNAHLANPNQGFNILYLLSLGYLF
jgi:hypothetical protein